MKTLRTKVRPGLSRNNRPDQSGLYISYFKFAGIPKPDLSVCVFIPNLPNLKFGHSTEH